MISDTLLRNIAAVEIILLAAGWLFLLAHGLRRPARVARQHRLREARHLLADAALGGSLSQEDRSTLRSLPVSEQRAVFRMLAPNLEGEERERLTGLAGELGLIDHCITLCDSRFWWRRLEGARLLTLVGGGDDRMLRMAGDPHPLVRGQIAEWCGINPSTEAVSTLVAMLGDPNQASRFAVQDALARLNGLITEPLADELARVQDATEAGAALLVAHAVGDNALAPSLTRFTRHPSPDVRAAAYRALGRTGGSEGESSLAKGLVDDASGVRAAAALAMGELGQWQGGRLVVRHLSDTSWDVRHAAGQALLLMGPPGQLLLRRALEDPDRFVADMARHTLDVARVRGRLP